MGKANEGMELRGIWYEINEMFFIDLTWCDILYQELPGTGMWYEINHIMLFARKQNAREWKKADVGIYHEWK